MKELFSPAWCPLLNSDYREFCRLDANSLQQRDQPCRHLIECMDILDQIISMEGREMLSDTSQHQV